jgi:transketolase
VLLGHHVAALVCVLREQNLFGLRGALALALAAAVAEEEDEREEGEDEQEAAYCYSGDGTCGEGGVLEFRGIV